MIMTLRAGLLLGLLLASSEKLVIQVKLGIFLGALKSNLEIEINKQLDLHL